MSEYVEIIGQIKPKNNQNFAIADVNDLKGGFYQVLTMDDMLSIPNIKRSNGMMCFVEEDPSEIYNYQLIDNVWTPAKLGGGGGTGIYTPLNKTIIKIGGIDKASDFTEGIEYNKLFDKIFSPNYDMSFPTKKIFFGYVQNKEYTAENIKQLYSPINYNEFDFKQYFGEGYVLISLPATYYLKKIEDSNGLNLVNAFNLTYKAINVQNDVDIYNIYLSPKITYNKELELTFYTKTGNPVQTSLTYGNITTDDINSALNSISIVEGIKSIINSIKVSIRNEESILVSVSYSPVFDINLNSFSITSREVNSQLINVSIVEGIPSLLKSITIVDGSSKLESVIFNEAIKSKLDSILIAEGKSTLIRITLNDGRSVLDKITVQPYGSKLTHISITSGISSLDKIIINEAIKSVLNSITINKI